MKSPSARRPRRPRRRTRLSSDQVRSRLYDGALARFRDQGYDATSVSELTRAAGVAKGTFFNHFPTKEHILAAWFEGVWAREVERTAGAGLAGTEALEAQFDGLMARLEEDPILAGALASRIQDLPSPEEGRGERPLDGARSWCVARIRECLPLITPILHPRDDDLAALVVGAFVETLREAFLPGAGRSSLRPALRRRLVFLLASAGIRNP
jgi:AcrR family transcriptional regulator